MVNTDNLSAEQQKRAETAVRVSEAFRKEGFQLNQYGGATVEFYTQGLYAIGDMDLGGAELYSNRFVRIQTVEGSLLMEAPGEEISQRLLYGIYPQPNKEQAQAAKPLVA